MLIDTTWIEALWVISTAFVGMIAIGAGMIGYWMRRLNFLERAVAVIIGFLLVYPEGIYSAIGLVAFVLMLGSQYWLLKKTIHRCHLRHPCNE